MRNRRIREAVRSVVFILALLVVTTLVAAIDVQEDIVQPAQSFIGSGYCRGGVDPPCFDCSGFVTRVYRPFVPELARISRDMARQGSAVSRSDLQPGDLVFFATGGRADAITHVAIYIGQNSIIHAISDGPNRGVNVTPLTARYWARRFHSARRVLRTNTATQDSRTEEAIRFATGLYTGELKNGEPHGNGRMELDNGDRYEGEFADGTFHGEGTYLWSNGDRYVGAFRDGTMHGAGTLTARSGEVTSGRWVNGDYQRPASQPDSSSDEPADTYLKTAESPWDTWDGIVEGDYYAWRQADDAAFEEFKRANNPSGSR